MQKYPEIVIKFSFFFLKLQKYPEKVIKFSFFS